MTLNDSYTAALTSTTNAEDVIDTTQTILITTERPEWVVILDYTSTILMTCNVIILMLAMGAATYWREIWDHVKRPWGCLFGMVCQFGFFPALGFGLCIGLQLPTYEALGVLILVCSPGGAFSNFFTYWVDGDLGLSILMTALSSLLALGVMPFNLWLYSMLWTTQKMNVPYANVLISLAFVTVPVLAGMVVRHFKKKWAAVVSKVCGLLGWLGALISGVLVCVIYWDSITTCSTHLLIIGATIPLLGAVAAYVISKIICFSHATCRTLAIETGSQNMVVAINVMLLSFTEPNIRGKMVIFPVLYGLFMLLEVAIAVGIYLLWSFFQQERVIEERVKTKIDNSILTSVPVPAHRLSESKIQKMTGFTLTPDLCQLQQEREEQLRREMATTTYHRFSESPRQPLDDLQLDEVEPILSYSASPRPNEETKMSPSQKPTTKNTLSDDSTDSTLPLYGRPQSPVYFKFPQVPNRSNQPFSGGGDDRDRRPFFKESYTFNPSHSPVSPTLSNKGVPNMFPVTEDDFRPSPGEESPPATAPYGSPIPIPKEKRIDWNQAIADVPSSPDPLTPKATLNSTKSFGFYHNDVRIGQSDQFNTFGRRKNAS